MKRDDPSLFAEPVPVETVAAKTAAIVRLLNAVARDYAPAVFASSMGAEDMVLTDMIWKAGIDIEIFTIDTGRLPEQTHELIARVERHYGRRIEVVLPEPAHVANFVSTYGIDGFYDSLEARKACCAARKVEPLKRKLSGKKAWITGLRATQSVTRSALRRIEYDQAHELVKFNPLVDWLDEEIWAYLRSQRVPYNVLHDRGYPSIGCAPCTRAVQPGEDIRAGRWWWESPATKECGLHVVDGRLVRISPNGAKAS